MRRRNRVLLPFAVLAAVLGGTLAVHELEQPDPADPAYLSPVSDDDLGARRLADALRSRGVTVDRRTSTAEALDALRAGPPATLFLPAPGFVDLDTVATATGLPDGTRVVLVAPDARTLEQTAWPVSHERTRWAAAAAEPGCPDPVFAAAGRAAVHRHQYATGDGVVCYDGGLVTFADGSVTVTLAGAADPFRNDRIGEHGNAALAAGLLAGATRVVWLDLHGPEDPPPTTEPEDPVSSASPPPVENDQPEAPRETPPLQPPLGGEGDTGEDGPAPDQRSLAEAFPAAVWASLLLAALALLALAAAAARRLGAPVTEPLPSRVPADETMLGHARLYQRARARGPSLEILRATARRQLTGHLGLPGDASTAELAAHAGLPPQYVRTILDGAPPRSDEDLVAAAAFVQRLVHDVLHPRQEQQNEGDPS